MKTITNLIFMLLLTFGISACSSMDREYGISGAYADIKEKQILDPMAPENNAGVVNTLQGNVGNKVITNYQSSTYSPKDGRVVAILE
jgi:hypothetical protein